MQAPGRWPKIETFRGDIYVYFNVNFNVLFKLTQMNLLVSELNIGLENVFFFLYNSDLAIKLHLSMQFTN